MAREGVTVAALEALYCDELAGFVRAAAAIAGDEGLGRDAVQEAFAQAVRARKAASKLITGKPSRRLCS